MLPVAGERFGDLDGVAERLRQEYRSRFEAARNVVPPRLPGMKAVDGAAPADGARS